MPSQLTIQQVELMALLTEHGHIQPSLLTLVRGGVSVGPIPIIRVAPGFLGQPGGYAFGWPAIGRFLNGVQEVFFQVFGSFFGGGQGEEGEREVVGGSGGADAAGVGEVGEGLRLLASEGGEVVDVESGDSDSSMDSCCGIPTWLPHDCSGRRGPREGDRSG